MKTTIMHNLLKLKTLDTINKNASKKRLKPDMNIVFYY